MSPGMATPGRASRGPANGAQGGALAEHLEGDDERARAGAPGLAQHQARPVAGHVLPPSSVAPMPAPASRSRRAIAGWPPSAAKISAV